jgi:hypothetical protein
VTTTNETVPSLTSQTSVINNSANKSTTGSSLLGSTGATENTAMVKADSIEETKVVINGIKVRAAKLSKLVDTLVNSFGKIIKTLFFENKLCGFKKTTN